MKVWFCWNARLSIPRSAEKRSIWEACGYLGMRYFFNSYNHINKISYYSSFAKYDILYILIFRSDFVYSFGWLSSILGWRSTKAICADQKRRLWCNFLNKKFNDILIFFYSVPLSRVVCRNEKLLIFHILIFKGYCYIRCEELDQLNAYA